MNTTQLIARVRRTAMLEDTSVDWTDTVILEELSEQLTQLFARGITKARCGYWLKRHVFTPTAGQAAYRIPARAVAGTLHRVQIAYSAELDYIDLDEVDEKLAQRYELGAGQVGTPARYVVRGDSVVLLPTPNTSAYSIRIHYYLRPSALIAPVTGGRIVSVDATARQLTINSTLGLPTTGATVDIIRPVGWGEVQMVSEPVVVAADNVTIYCAGTGDISAVEAGDVVRVAGQTDVVPIPEDYHRVLADSTAAKILQVRGFAQQAASVDQIASADLARFGDLLAPRVQTSGKAIVVPSNLYRGRRSVSAVVTGLTGASSLALTNTVQPSAAFRMGAGSWGLVKDWNFGTSGNVGNNDQLKAEFQFSDNFGTIANGTHYGALMVAPDVASAVVDPTFGLQPVDPTGSRFRQFTATSMIANVLPLSTTPGATLGPASAHNGGCGSLTAKLKLPSGGRYYGKDIAWETRVRMLNAPEGYWFALWTCGDEWDGGPEMDVLEAYTDTVPSGLVNGDAFHVNSVGGVDERFDYALSWWTGMTASEMPGIDANGPQNLKNWHVFTWLYRHDDTYEVYIDGYLFQRGFLAWKVPSNGHVPAMSFLWDFTALHTDLSPINTVVMPAANLPLQYEIDYSRVWVR